MTVKVDEMIEEEIAARGLVFLKTYMLIFVFYFAFDLLFFEGDFQQTVMIVRAGLLILLVLMSHLAKKEIINPVDGGLVFIVCFNIFAVSIIEMGNFTIDEVKVLSTSMAFMTILFPSIITYCTLRQEFIKNANYHVMILILYMLGRVDIKSWFITSGVMTLSFSLVTFYLSKFKMQSLKTVFLTN